MSQFPTAIDASNPSSKPISKSKSKRKSRSKSISIGSTTKSSTKRTSNHYHFKQDSLCDADSDGRCDVELVSTENDDREELRCAQCPNKWDENEIKYCCIRSDCHNTFCERCVMKDKTEAVKSKRASKRSSKRRHRSFPSTKHKKNDNAQSETDDEYQQTTSSPSVPTTESSPESESSSNHNHNHNKSNRNESETETPSTTSSEFRKMVKKKSLFSTKKVAIRTTNNCMDTDESMNDNDSTCSNRKRKMSDSKYEEDGPPHKKMKLSHDKKGSFAKKEHKKMAMNAQKIKEIIATKNEDIECLYQLKNHYKKKMEEYRAIALKQCEELKMVKAEGMKCVEIINGLRKERAVYKEKYNEVMEFFNLNNEDTNGANVNQMNGHNENNVIVNGANANHQNRVNNAEEIINEVVEQNNEQKEEILINEERERSIEDGEIIEHDDDIKTNAANTNNISNESNDTGEALDVRLNANHRPLQKRRKKKSVKEEQNETVPTATTIPIAIEYNIVNGVVDLTSD